MRTINVGIIGAGGIFPNHAEALRAIERTQGTCRANLVALCDLDLDLAHKCAAEYGIPTVTNDWRDLIARPVDALFILTPPSAHREPAVAALGAGIHVFCEKPLAHTLADGRAILDAARASKAVCQVGFNNLFEPATRQMWRMSARGECGRLVRAYDRHTVFRASTSWTDPKRRDRWRLDQAASGGRMQEFGSHKVNWLVAVGGKVRTVVGRADSVAEALAERGVDDVNLLLADFERGGVGTVEVSLVPTTWNAWSVGIQGAEAGVEWSSGKTLLVRRKDAEKTEEIPVESVPETRQAHFFRWITEIGDPAQCPTPEVTAEAAYHVLEVCLAFLESARTGAMQRIGQPS